MAWSQYTREMLWCAVRYITYVHVELLVLASLCTYTLQCLSICLSVCLSVC